MRLVPEIRTALAVSIALALASAFVPSPATLALVVGWSILCTVWIGAAGFREFRAGEERTIRSWIAAITVLMTTGTIIRGVHGSIVGIAFPFPSTADLIHFPAYCLFLAALIHVHRRRATRLDVAAWLDGIALATAASIVAWVTFYADFLQDDRINATTKVLQAPFDIIMVAALATVLRISASPGRRPAAYYLLATACATWVVIDLIAGYTITTGDGLSITIALSPIVYGFTFAAARHPSIVEVLQPHREGELRISRLRLILIPLTLLTPLLVLVTTEGTSIDQLVLAALVAILVVVAIARIVRLLQAQQYQADLERRSAEEVARFALASPNDALANLPVASARIVPRIHPFMIGASPTSDESQSWEVRIDGQEHRLSTRASVTPGESRVISSFVGEVTQMTERVIVRDLHDRQRRDAEINRVIAINEQRFRALVQNASDLVLIIDGKGIIAYMSEASTRVLGAAPEDFVGRDVNELVFEDDVAIAQQHVRVVLDGIELPNDLEVRINHQDGSTRLFTCTFTDMFAVEGVEGLVINASDVTDKRSLEQDLVDAATTDSLTLMLNRNAFIDETSTALRRASLGSHLVSVAIINLDNFREINEGLGPLLADQVLISAAHAIRRSIRLSDSVARLSGDEFAILMPHTTAASEVLASIERVIEELAVPVTVGERKLHIQASAGVAVETDPGVHGPELLRKADTALDFAKRSNRGGAVLYAESMGQAASERIDIRNRLTNAIANGEMRLVYQPIIDISSGEIVSLESLARWEHPDRGNIPPSVFIPIAESSGLIDDLGEWALETACNQLVEWSALGIENMSISVNMSGQQIRSNDVISRVKGVLARTGVDPRCVVIEITESVLIDNSDFIAGRIQVLRGLGMQLAIDDFGTGYSSLSYLERYEFDVLKIDRSFVTGLDEAKNKRRAEIVRSIIALARGLDAVTVAEGIEEESERHEVTRLGCDRAQGFFYYRPTEANRIPNIIAAASPARAA